jgi:hypothetical protein
MTLSDVEERIASIRRHAARDDFEAAHSEEDELLAEVLQAIAEGVENAPALAKAALTSLDIEFSRYCA